MDEITLEDIAPQIERELTPHPSPKRPRMDFTMTNTYIGVKRFDFPRLWTFQKTPGSPSSKNILEKKAPLICSSTETGDERKPHEQPQHVQLIVPPIFKVTASHTDVAHKGPSEIVITGERDLPHLGKDEQPPLAESDKISSSPRDDAGGTLEECHTSRDTSADTSSQPDCERPPGGYCPPAAIEKNGRQVLNTVSHIQVCCRSSSDEEVTYQSDCDHEEALHPAGVCNSWSRSAEVQASDPGKCMPEISEDILFSKEKGDSHVSLSPGEDADSSHSNSEEHASGNVTSGVENEGKISEGQICEKVALSDCETKDHINHNGTGEKRAPPVQSECAGRPNVSRDVVSARNTAAENASVDVDDFCGAKGEHAAGKMIAKAWTEPADHTTETPKPARIGKEPAEGDNDPGPFSVMDPAIWSESDREAEEKCCNSAGTASVEGAPSVKACGTETQELSAHDQAGQCNHPSATQQCEDNISSQSYSEPHACSSPVNETHNITGNDSSCHWKSGPSKSPHEPTNPPLSEHESQRVERHQLKEQSHSDCFPLSLDHLQTQHIEYSQKGTARLDSDSELNESEDTISCVGQIKTSQYVNLENEIESWVERLQRNDGHTVSVGGCIGDWTEGEISDLDQRLTLVGHEETTEAKERKEGRAVGEENKGDGRENPEMLVKAEEDPRQQSELEPDTADVSPDSHIGERTGGNVGACGQDSQHEQGNGLSGFPGYRNTAEMLMDVNENKEDFLALPFAPARDALGPCQQDVSHSRNSNNNPTAPNCDDRFSPAPSVLTFCDRLPGGFDTFEKIQLSPNGDDGDADDDAVGPGDSPLLTSLPWQLLKTSEQQLAYSVPRAEGGEREEVTDEAGSECDMEDMRPDVLSRDSTFDQFPNFYPEADIIFLGRPEQEPDCDSSCDSRDHTQEEINLQSTCGDVPTESDVPSGANVWPEFEMKQQLDVVLKELKLFFDIDVSDVASVALCGDSAKASESDVSNCKHPHSSPELRHHGDASSDDADEDSGVVSFGTGRCDGEQEVPLGSHMCQETSVYATEKRREPQEIEERRKMWSPSFTCSISFEQLSQRPPELSRRLEPLRTCTRPIRVGLSKRARTKHLHRPHPCK